MACSLSQTKQLLSLLHCRGLAVSASKFESHVPLKVEKELEDTSTATTKEASPEETSSVWGPDPVTGYYRPINRPPEIDSAELRLMLLNYHRRVKPTSNSSS